MLQIYNYMPGTVLGAFYSLAPSLELIQKKCFFESSFYNGRDFGSDKQSNLSKFPSHQPQRQSSHQGWVWLWTWQSFPCPTRLSPSSSTKLSNPPTQVKRVGLLINTWKGWWINLTLERFASGSGLLTLWEDNHYLLSGCIYSKPPGKCAGDPRRTGALCLCPFPRSQVMGVMWWKRQVPTNITLENFW